MAASHFHEHAEVAAPESAVGPSPPAATSALQLRQEPSFRLTLSCHAFLFSRGVMSTAGLGASCRYSCGSRPSRRITVTGRQPWRSRRSTCHLRRSTAARSPWDALCRSALNPATERRLISTPIGPALGLGGWRSPYPGAPPAHVVIGPSPYARIRWARQCDDTGAPVQLCVAVAPPPAAPAGPWSQGARCAAYWLRARYCLGASVSSHPPRWSPRATD